MFLIFDFTLKVSLNSKTEGLYYQLTKKKQDV